MAIVIGGLEQAFWFVWGLVVGLIPSAEGPLDPGNWWETYDEGVVLSEPGAGMAMASLISVQAPIVEELIFRALLFAGLRHWMPLWPAALLSGLIFGVVHGYPLMGLISVSLGGAIYAIAYEWTRSIAVCILAHAIHNSMILMLMILIGWSVQ